ncbi:hypothetical protein LTR84_002604 [Exophiala bonariae]|uniref:Uncharacterized protein n=1 Tax=Exophiala bonariae TaxID=1690606 RepID=A0AAV9N9Y3_9EURO|nr:hypothetical protein LTR84_002604 [Exophiala bonariae]
MDPAADDLESIQEAETRLNFEEREIDLDRRSLQLERDREELRKKQERDAMKKDGARATPVSQHPMEATDSNSRENSTVTVIPSSPQATTNPDTNISDPSAGGRVVGNGNPEDEPRPALFESDRPGLVSGSLRIPPSPLVPCTGSRSSYPGIVNRTIRNSENHDTPTDVGTESNSTKEATAREKRRRKLYKPHNYVDNKYEIFTVPIWWEVVAEPFFDNYTSLIDMLVKCKAKGPAADWSPLEFLQRANFISIFRQAGLAGTKSNLNPRITTADVKDAAEHPELYDNKDELCADPEFQRVLREGKLEEVGGLYWPRGEVPLNFAELNKNGGRPGTVNGTPSNIQNAGAPNVHQFPEATRYQVPRVSEERDERSPDFTPGHSRPETTNHLDESRFDYGGSSSRPQRPSWSAVNPSNERKRQRVAYNDRRWGEEEYIIEAYH